MDTNMHMKHGLITIGAVATMALASGAEAQTVTPPPVPTTIQLPEPAKAFLLGRGVGTQNYECQPVASLGRVNWVLFTPQATLFDDLKDQLITHFFSPNPQEDNLPIRVTWQDSKDTSIVWGKVIASAIVDPNAIAWLTVQATGTQVGPFGGTTLSDTTFIQRLNTVGGLAPTTGCDIPTDIGRKRFVPYTADYFFFKKP